MSKRVAYLAIVGAALVALLADPRPLVAAECTNLEAYAAETVADYLDSWKNVHFAFKQFAKCDDGGVAEGYSEAVARLLADRWTTLPELVRLIQGDPAFEAFVLGHIDETVNESDLIVISKHASGECPSAARELCTKIRARTGVSEKVPQ